MSLIERLKAKRGFTAVELAIASYILRHAEEVPHMTVGELSEAASVSKAAIIRLCQKLGLRGYRELRLELASELERRRSHLSDIDVNQPFSSRESSATTLRSIAELQREALDECYQSLAPELVDEVAGQIVQARRVVIYAAGDSCLVASLFASKLSKLGIVCINAGLYADYFANTTLVGPGDLALFVSYSGLLLKGMLQNCGIDVVGKRGCVTVAVTGLEEDDPLVRDADHILSFASRELQDGAIGSFYSLTCMNYIFNCIYARVYSRDFERFGQMKAEVDGLNRKNLER